MQSSPSLGRRGGIFFWWMPYYLIALSAYLLPYLWYWGQLGTGDWDQAATWAQIAVWWHQQGDYSVGWNPFLCGGLPLFGNPQIPFFHPSLPLYWLFGPAVGLKLMVLIWMTVGFWLADWFLKSLDFSPREAALFGAVWVLNGFFVAHLGQMHAHFVCFFLVPGFYLVTRRWVETANPRFLVGLAVLTLVAAAHSYGFLVYFFLSVPSYLFFEVGFRRMPWRVAIRRVFPWLAVVVCSLLALAFYLLPALEYLREFPRHTGARFENPLKLVTYLFFPGSISPPSGGFSAWEYQVFIGPVLFVFFVLALRRFREIPLAYRPLLACAVMHLLLAVGSLRAIGSPVPSAFDLMRAAVPFFGNVQVTSRFLIGALPGILVLAFWEWRRRGIGPKLTILVLAPLIGFQLDNTFRLAFRPALLAEKKGPPVVDTGFRWEQGASTEMYRDLLPDRGVANCYESTPLPSEAGKAFSGALLSEPPKGLQWQWPHWGRLHFISTPGLPAPTELRLKINPHKNWSVRSNHDPSPQIVSAPAEALKLSLPAGPIDFDLVFEDPSVARSRRISFWGALVGILFLLRINVLTTGANHVRKSR